MRVLQRHGIHYFFYIGGNDSAETAHIINEEARKAGVVTNMGNQAHAGEPIRRAVVGA